MQRRYTQNFLKTLWARGRYFLALLRAKLRGGNIPLICVLVVTNRCNFNCKYCFGSYAKRKTEDYTTGELKFVIDELYKLGTRYLNIHGGETLMREDIGEIVDYIKSKGIYCCLITNGSLLAQKIGQIRNVDNLTISLDGCKDNNDRNRGGGSYEKALGAVKLALENKIPLRVSATLTKYTAGDIEYLARLAKELGFTVHFSILFKPLPQFKEYEMTDAEIRAAMARIIELKKAGYPIFTSYRAAQYAHDWPLDHNEHHFITESAADMLPKSFKPLKCFYGKLKFTIEADGNIYPCFPVTEHFKPLNWKTAGVQKAIEHVIENNDCIACAALTQNDHNILLGLEPKQIARLALDQLKEAFRRK